MTESASTEVQEPEGSAEKPGASSLLVALIALCAGITVSNLYLTQPLLPLVAESVREPLAGRVSADHRASGLRARDTTDRAARGCAATQGSTHVRPGRADRGPRRNGPGSFPRFPDGDYALRELANDSAPDPGPLARWADRGTTRALARACSRPTRPHSAGISSSCTP
jgi:hypothetical protein